MPVIAHVRGVGAARAATLAARREVDAEVKRILLRIATTRTLPTARSLAPSIVSSTIVARSSRRSVYLTTSARGWQRRRFGLLEHGGRVSGAIRPRRRGVRALAIPTPGGVIYRASVSRARTHPPLAFMRRAIAQTRPWVRRGLEREIPAAIERRLHGISATGP